MGWIKRNLFFVVGGLLALGLLGGAGYFIWTGWGRNSEASNNLNERYETLKGIAQSPLQPGNEKVNNTKIAQDQEKQPNVSIVDLTFISEKTTDAKAVNAALKAASEGELKGILGYDENLLVSSDFKGNPLSSIVDAPLTKVVGNSVKVLSWYDNEWGYSSRVVDLIGFLVKKGL